MTIKTGAFCSTCKGEIRIDSTCLCTDEIEEKMKKILGKAN